MQRAAGWFVLGIVGSLACGPSMEPEAPPTPAPPEAPRSEAPDGEAIPGRESDPAADVSLPLDRITTVPESVAEEFRQPDLSSTPSALREPREAAPGDDSLLSPSVRVESEAIESAIPGETVETRGLHGGVTVAPGESVGGAEISVEGGVREQLRESRPEAPEREGAVGVRIEVPWPGEKDD